MSVIMSEGVWLNLFADNQILLFGISAVAIAGFMVKLNFQADKSQKKSKLDPKAAGSKFVSKTGSKTGSANAERPFGHWDPDYTFKTPVPEAYPNWDINKTKPVPYRAFKHHYHVTMGIRNMDWQSWIELDNQWQYYHDLKLKRLGTLGKEIYGISDKALDACWELLFELCNFLPKRYPTLFSYDENTKILEIKATNEIFDLKDTENLNPIVTAGKLIQDDLAVLVENEQGSYSLEAGCVALAGFWRLKDKYQMTLDDLHLSADVPVPDYKQKLGPAMNRFFRRLPVGQPVLRNNYFIQTDNDLAWSFSIGKETDEKVGWYTAAEATDINQLHLRSERQSLRRLPISGAIVFTIRTYFLPITELCKEPYVPRRLLNGMNSWQDNVQEYKGFEKYKKVLLPYLEKMAEEQEANGLVLEEEPQTYPY
ncbi:hypothetical protein KGF56_000160 [Candida oxycetoniae]|uniref:HRQ family protein 1 n=1 Tax=Candida oxycetoniae TaxID=497107 RepID=A0AAI9X056_9ASCO|nr:uncharacterized protein KGF56_000160 [Candida oxycetoniae]KAI3407072.2 hypothetical protein KGF56_000160 [Candida oxycetoniae]